MYRVMIVDDEPIIRQGLTALVKQSGLPIAAISTAENGVDALERIRVERPDILFTDIRMPKMDGLQLCRAVSELDEEIQIVVISGYSDFEYARECVSYGVKEYMLKPVNKTVVHDVLRKLVERAGRQPSRPFVSMSKLEQLVEETDQAIWNQQMAKLKETIASLRSECEEYRLSFHALTELIGDYYSLLIKRLNTRDVFAFVSGLRLQEATDANGAWQLVESALADIYNELRNKRKGKTKDPVEEAKRYIEEHLALEVSLEEVADFIGLNSSYFSQLFKQTTGETFVQFRIRRRMEKAKKLLEIPHYRITDISSEVGYADHPHFTKTFKKYTGQLPSEYRLMLGID